MEAAVVGNKSKKRPMSQNSKVQKKPKTSVWIKCNPEFPKYAILNIAPFLCSKELHAMIHTCKALHTNICGMDGIWTNVLKRLDLQPGRRSPYSFLSRQTKNNPVKMCVCNREPVNINSKDHNGQKVSKGCISCWLCSVDPLTRRVPLEITTVFPLLFGDVTPIAKYLNLMLSDDQTFNPPDRNILAELARCLQTSHPNKLGWYSKSFMSNALQKILGMPIQVGVKEGSFRLGDFKTSTTLRDVQNDYFQLCRVQIKAVLGIEITEEPLIPLVCSDTIERVALGCFLDPRVLLIVLKMQQELDIAPVTGVPPIALVLRRLLDTCDTVRFRQLCTITEYRIDQSDKYLGQFGSGYIWQCVELWIKKVTRDSIDSDMWVLYRKAFNREMPSPRGSDYNLVAVYDAISDNIQPVVDKALRVIDNIRTEIYMELAKMMATKEETDEKTKEATEWIHLQMKEAGPIIHDAARLFYPLELYQLQNMDNGAPRRTKLLLSATCSW